MNNLYENKYILLSVIVVIVLIFVGLVIYSLNRESFKQFRMVSTLPESNQSFPSSSNQINVKFNREINANKITLDDIDSNFLVSEIIVDKKILVLKLRTLIVNKNYNINIKKVESTSGEILTNTKLSFTTKYIPFSDLSKEEQKLQIEDTDPKPKIESIKNFIPYSTSNYSIVSGELIGPDGKTKPAVVVKDLFYMGINPPYPESEIKASAETINKFLSSTGVDRNTYFLTADNSVLAKYINADALPKGSKIQLDSYGGDGI